MNRILLLLLAVSGEARAESPRCPELAGPQSVLDCILLAHPSARGADALLKQSEALEGAAGQRINPEVDGSAVFGRSSGQSTSEVEVTVLHTFETAGKRSRRVARARAEAQGLRGEALATREELTIDAVLSLHRLRQIGDELKLLKEALGTFSGIAKQLEERPRRSPEQQVSMSVFQLAARDYSLRLASVESERAALRRGLELGLGTALPDSDALLPPRPSQWPDPGTARDSTTFRGSAALRAAAAVETARADLGAARAESYPDLGLGPSLKREKAGSASVTSLGAALSLPLPLYQRNKGGRLLAERSLETAGARSAAAFAILAAERDAEAARYRAATQSLSRAGDREDLETQHEEMEDLFERGIIASSLVIEAHRQIVDYTTGLHELEHTAIRALWTIYAIEGRILTEKL